MTRSFSNPRLAALIAALSFSLPSCKEAPKGGKELDKAAAAEAADKDSQTPAAPAAPEDSAQDSKIAAMEEEIFDKFPELSTTYRVIEDKDNRLLQLAVFLHEKFPDGESSSVAPPEELSTMLSGLTEWHSETIRDWLKERSALLDDLIAIAQLPGFSADLPDDAPEVDAESMAALTPLLLGKAHCEMDGGDSAAAIKTLGAAAALAECLEASEAPSASNRSLGARVSTQLAGDIEKYACEAPVARETLVRLRDVLHSLHRDPASGLIAVIHRDWFDLFLSCMRPEEAPAKLNEEERIALVWELSEMAAVRIRQIHTGELHAVPEETPLPDLGISNLSKNAQEGQQYMDRDLSPFGDSWLKQERRIRMMEAAIAVALGDAPPNDPITGKPFLIDRSAGVVASPHDVDLTEAESEVVESLGATTIDKQKIPVLKQ